MHFGLSARTQASCRRSTIIVKQRPCLGFLPSVHEASSIHVPSSFCLLQAKQLESQEGKGLDLWKPASCRLSLSLNRGLGTKSSLHIHRHVFAHLWRKETEAWLSPTVRVATLQHLSWPPGSAMWKFGSSLGGLRLPWHHASKTEGNLRDFIVKPAHQKPQQTCAAV